MPLVKLLLVLAYKGIKEECRKDKGYSYQPCDMNNMLKEMTGKSKAECRRILKKYGRK